LFWEALKINRYKEYYSYSARKLVFSKVLIFNINCLPKLNKLKIFIKKKSFFNNLLISGLFLLLFITKQFGKIIKNNKPNYQIIKKPKMLSIITSLVKHSMFYFLDNLISIVLPSITQLIYFKIKLLKNKIYD
jgi:ribosomal protein L5